MKLGWGPEDSYLYHSCSKIFLNPFFFPKSHWCSFLTSFLRLKKKYSKFYCIQIKGIVSELMYTTKGLKLFYLIFWMKLSSVQKKAKNRSKRPFIKVGNSNIFYLMLKYKHKLTKNHIDLSQNICHKIFIFTKEDVRLIFF